MWIVLFIIAVWTGLKRKLKKKSIKQAVFLLILVCLLITKTKAQTSQHNVSGQIYTENTTGTLYIFLVDETTYKTPFTGIDTLIIPVDSFIVNYCFKEIEKGTYAIRAYQDINNNCTLDRKALFPSEPYGFSWKHKAKFPFKFEDISFQVNNNTSIQIHLKKH